MKKNSNNESTQSNATTPVATNGRRKNKRAKKAAAGTKAQTRAKRNPNSGTMKLIEQATKALNRANVALGKIKF